MKTKTSAENPPLKKITMSRLNKPIGPAFQKTRETTMTGSGTTCGLSRW